MMLLRILRRFLGIELGRKQGLSKTIHFLH